MDKRDTQIIDERDMRDSVSACLQSLRRHFELPSKSRRSLTGLRSLSRQRWLQRRLRSHLCAPSKCSSKPRKVLQEFNLKGCRGSPKPSKVVLGGCEGFEEEEERKRRGREEGKGREEKEKRKRRRREEEEKRRDEKEKRKRRKRM
eukprot:s38_g4.t1